MIKPVNELFQYPIPNIYKGKILKYFAKPQSTTSGIIRFLVKPGDIVKKIRPGVKPTILLGDYKKR